MKRTITLCLLILTTYLQGQTNVRNVDAKLFRDLAREKEYVLIDLRTDEEMEKRGYIKGAMQINFLDKQAEAAIDKLDKDKTYLVYCAGGGRSADCTELMRNKGFKEVINLEKGFDEWLKKGFEVEQRTEKK